MLPNKFNQSLRYQYKLNIHLLKKQTPFLKYMHTILELLSIIDNCEIKSINNIHILRKSVRIWIQSIHLNIINLQ